MRGEVTSIARHQEIPVRKNVPGILVAGLGVTAALAFASACSSDSATTDTAATPTAEAQDTPASPTTTDTAAAPTAGAAASPGMVALMTGETSLGTVVTTEGGLTLYRFERDTPQPPTSNCEGDCARNWPPLIAADAEVGAGIDPALVGSVTRSDGTTQVTLNGWPLYTYVGDEMAGDVNGEGVGDVWYAVGVDGMPAAG
jgi:predicted lipoprotein with Yx(FWY)xxD motif